MKLLQTFIPSLNLQLEFKAQTADEGQTRMKETVYLLGIR